ncbi:MAG: hypothetical protein S4CHLAM81_03210 [Chlamydiales bacterium]|nr:hypothetical protein [Chlamydiales bacterium]MCH9635111.1 hypothetical protein [Chlamydiales bacterium]MCH9703827.1 SpoIIE family protein phosphatase [Chlamydiota bacterium]
MISFRKTIGFRLILMSFLLLTLPLVIDAAVVFTKRYQTRVQASIRYLTESAVLRVLPTASYEPFPEISFDVLVKELGLEENFPEKPDPKLNETLVKLAKIGNLDDLTIARIDEEGHYIIVASAEESIVGNDVTNYFHSPTPFEIAEEYSDPVAAYLSYRDNFVLYMVLALGIRSPEGKPIGVVTAVTDATWWVNQVLAEEDTYYPVRFAVLNPDTMVTAASDPELLFNYFEPLSQKQIENFSYRELYRIKEVIAEEPLEVLQSMRLSNYMRFVWQGQEQFGVVEPMPWWNYALMAYASKREIYALPLRDFVGIFVSYTVILLLGGILTYFITKRWMQPVQTLGSVMLNVQEGDLNARYKPDRFGSLVNDLGRIFNSMVDRLLASKAKAEEERLAKEVFEEELKLGTVAQMQLLKEPNQDFGSADVAQLYIPASQVGGDFYDIFRKKNGKLVLAIADASGKGVMACCYSLAARNLLRTFSMQSDDLGYVMQKSNNLFCDDTGESGMFVTVEMVQYDYENSHLSYYSLGHNPGIVCHNDGSVERLDSGDMAMGVLAKKEIPKAKELSLGEGDTIVLYTDGVTEMHNSSLELYGEDRLIELIQKERGKTAAELVEAIRGSIESFADGYPQFDDVTLIVMRVGRE